jgi:hypothetical protein
MTVTSGRAHSPSGTSPESEFLYTKNHMSVLQLAYVAGILPEKLFRIMLRRSMAPCLHMSGGIGPDREFVDTSMDLNFA